MLVEHLLLNLRLESSVNLYISKTFLHLNTLLHELESSVNLYISKTKRNIGGKEKWLESSVNLYISKTVPPLILLVF